MGDKLRGHGRGFDRRPVVLGALAGPTSVLGPDVADNLYGGRDEVEFFGDFLADASELAAAGTDLVRFRNVVDDLDAGKFLRNRTASGLFAGVGGDGDLPAFDGFGLAPGHCLGLVEEGVLNFLGRGLGLALRLGQMQDRLEQTNLLLQLVDVAGFIGKFDLVLGCQTGNKPFERGRVVGQGSDVHGP